MDMTSYFPVFQNFNLQVRLIPLEKGDCANHLGITPLILTLPHKFCSLGKAIRPSMAVRWFAAALGLSTGGTFGTRRLRIC